MPCAAVEERAQNALQEVQIPHFLQAKGIEEQGDKSSNLIRCQAVDIEGAHAKGSPLRSRLLRTMGLGLGFFIKVKQELD